MANPWLELAVEHHPFSNVYLVNGHTSQGNDKLVGLIVREYGDGHSAFTYHVFYATPTSGGMKDLGKAASVEQGLGLMAGEKKWDW